MLEIKLVKEKGRRLPFSFCPEKIKLLIIVGIFLTFLKIIA